MLEVDVVGIGEVDLNQLVNDGVLVFSRNSLLDTEEQIAVVGRNRI